MHRDISRFWGWGLVALRVSKKSWVNAFCHGLGEQMNISFFFVKQPLSARVLGYEFMAHQAPDVLTVHSGSYQHCVTAAGVRGGAELFSFW